MENTVTISLEEYKNLIETNNNYKNLYQNEGYSLQVIDSYHPNFSSYTYLLTNSDVIEKQLNKANEYIKLCKEYERNENKIKEITKREVLDKNLLQLIKWWFKNKNN